MGLIVATKAFFKLMFNRELSESFERLAAGNLPKGITDQSTAAAPAKPSPPPAPVRSDAISLLAALQREARFVDIVSESLDGYSDAQVGAAARDVIRDSGKVIERMFGLEPLTEIADGQSLTTPENFDPNHFRLTGNVTGEAPYHGTVAHHGWRATRCEVPKWSGNQKAALIVAPVELEVS